MKPPKDFQPGDIAYRYLDERCIIMGEPEFHAKGFQHYVGNGFVRMHNEAEWCVPTAVCKTGWTTTWQPRWWPIDFLYTWDEASEVVKERQNKEIADALKAIDKARERAQAWLKTERPMRQFSASGRNGS